MGKKWFSKRELFADFLIHRLKTKVLNCPEERGRPEAERVTRRVLKGRACALAVIFCFPHGSIDIDLPKSFFFKVLGVMLTGLVGVGRSRLLSLRLDNIGWKKYMDTFPI